MKQKTYHQFMIYKSKLQRKKQHGVGFLPIDHWCGKP